MGENLSLGFPTMSDTNQAVQPQKMARDLKFLIKELEGLYYLCSKNKGTDKLRCAVTAQLICAFVSTCAKSMFSHDKAHYFTTTAHCFPSEFYSNKCETRK